MTVVYWKVLLHWNIHECIPFVIYQLHWPGIPIRLSSEAGLYCLRPEHQDNTTMLIVSTSNYHTYVVDSSRQPVFSSIGRYSALSYL